NQVGAAPHAEFREKIGDVELYGSFGDVQPVCNFLIGKVLQQGIEDFLFAPAQAGGSPEPAVAWNAVQDGIHEAGQHRPRHPIAPARDVLQGATRLAGGLGVGDRKSTRLNSSHVAISYAV